MPIADHIEYIDPKEIVVGDRQRTATTTNNLLSSINALGILNPLIVTHSQEMVGAPLQIFLIAGRRRLACAIELGFASVPVRFYETLSASEQKTIELEENIKREDLSPQDFVRAVGELHEMKIKEDPTWTIEKTADLISYSKRYMNDILAVYKSINIPAIATANTISNAINTLNRLNERRRTAVTEDLLRAPSTTEKLAEAPIEALPTETFLSHGGTELTTIRHNPLGDDEILEIRPNPDLKREQITTKESPIIVADFLIWSKTYSGPKFNVIHCDFPIETFEQHLSALTSNLDTMFSYSGHILLWFDFDFDYGIVCDELSRTGLYVIDHPLVWVKSDTKNSSIAGAEPKHSYETALLAYRGGRPLICQNTNSYSSQGVASPIHPEQKPEPMLRHFLAMLIDPVTDFLDPTAGSGSALRAAEDLGARTTFGIEINPEYAKAANEATLRSRSLRTANRIIQL